MAKKVFTVPEVPGSKRSSERPYSHAVIGRYSGEVAAANAEADMKANGKKYRSWDVKSWNNSAEAVKAKPGELYRNHNGFMVPMSESMLAIELKFMEKYPSLEAYLESKQAEHKGYVESLRAQGLGPLVVLRWSMSLANAMKSWSEFPSYIELRAVPCVEVVKQKA